MLSMSDRAMANFLAYEARGLLKKAQPILARADGAEQAYMLSACNLLALAGRELDTAAQDPAERNPTPNPKQTENQDADQR